MEVIMVMVVMMMVVMVVMVMFLRCHYIVDVQTLLFDFIGGYN